MKLLIGADIVPTDNNMKYFLDGNIEYLMGHDLMKLFDSADFKILNLEVPLTNIEQPIKKCGPNLIAPKETINGLMKINSCFYALANNHILDQSEQGLISTMNLLESKNIAYAGAGKNINEASKPHIFEKEGLRVGIYCCAEHEFTIATKKTAGANPFDPLKSFDDVQKLKSNCDYVIVIFHGGKEMYRYPSPYIQEVFRKFSDNGADAVISQHSHCIGCYEKYNDAYLIYGQGNFLFSRVHDEFWDSSLLIELNLEENKKELTFHPIVSKQNYIRYAKDEEANTLMHEFMSRSNEIKNEEFVVKNYDEYIKKFSCNYARAMKGRISILKRAYLKLFKKDINYFYSIEEMLLLLNYIECESHRELLIRELKNCIAKSITK